MAFRSSEFIKFIEMSERNLHWTIFSELQKTVNIFSYGLCLFCSLRSLGKLYCKVVNAYLHVGFSIVCASIFKVGCSRDFSFTLATQHFALFLYRFTMENNVSSSAEKDYLGDQPVAGTRKSEFNRNPTTAESSRRSNY